MYVNRYLHWSILSCFSPVWLFATLWTIAHRLLCPWDSPGKNLGAGCHTLRGSSHLGIEPMSLACPALAGRFFTTSTTWEAQISTLLFHIYHFILCLHNNSTHVIWNLLLDIYACSSFILLLLTTLWWKYMYHINFPLSDNFFRKNICKLNY